MHLGQCTIGIAALLVSCGRTITLHLTPSLAGHSDSASAQVAARQADALAAVERLAARYDVAPKPGDIAPCARAWLARDYDRGRVQQLHICVMLPADGVKVVFTEFVGWSPRSDSLRQALADTLGRFGTVRRK